MSGGPCTNPDAALYIARVTVRYMDAGTPDLQYVDEPGDAGGIWYYQIAAFNAVCGAEGPW